MNRRERLMASLRGEAVDRPAISFYELNGLDQRPEDGDPFNIYSDPSWLPLLELTRARTDCIVLRAIERLGICTDPFLPFSRDEAWIEGGSRLTRRSFDAGGRSLTARTRRDPDLDTVWTTEHLLKGAEDLEALLSLPEIASPLNIDPSPVAAAEAVLGDAGIVGLDAPDPLCLAAALFDMAEYTVVAMCEGGLFRRLLDRMAAFLMPGIEAAAAALPGRLWRIYGPEYASPPYLPPQLFREYVLGYDKAIVDAIHRSGGYARIHCHGNLREILPDIAALGADALDPIEPPSQGDVELSYVRERYGEAMLLFGNLEASDIENLDQASFERRVAQALEEGTSGPGRGFVLMPSASPYGRKLSPLALRNYETIVRLAGA
jgi:hypothetical protein